MIGRQSASQQFQKSHFQQETAMVGLCRTSHILYIQYASIKTLRSIFIERSFYGVSVLTKTLFSHRSACVPFLLCYRSAPFRSVCGIRHRFPRVQFNNRFERQRWFTRVTNSSKYSTSTSKAWKRPRCSLTAIIAREYRSFDRPVFRRV